MNYEYVTRAFFDPKTQDEEINRLAGKGWEPHLMSALVVPRQDGTARETIIIVFRREVDPNDR